MRSALRICATNRQAFSFRRASIDRVADEPAQNNPERETYAGIGVKNFAFNPAKEHAEDEPQSYADEAELRSHRRERKSPASLRSGRSSSPGHALTGPRLALPRRTRPDRRSP